MNPAIHTRQDDAAASECTDKGSDQEASGAIFESDLMGAGFEQDTSEEVICSGPPTLVPIYVYRPAWIVRIIENQNSFLGKRSRDLDCHGLVRGDGCGLGR